MPSTVTDQHLALFDVLVDGAKVDDELQSRMTEIRVSDYLALPDLCTFTVGFDLAEQLTAEKQPIDSHPFKIGASLEVKLGKREKLQTGTVFKGQIVTLEPHFTSGGAELAVRAFDRSHLLNRSRKVRTFQQMKASEIVTKIVGEHGLSPQVTSTKVSFPFMQQDNETDLDFVWRLANRIGYEFIVDDTKAHFRPVGSTPPIEIEWPVDVHDFRPRMTGVQQVDKVTVRSWDSKAKAVQSAVAQAPNQTAQIGAQRSAMVTAFKAKSSILIPTEPTVDRAEAQELAQAMLDRLANAYVTAEGACIGHPDIRAGAVVKVKGVGTTYTGTYRVLSSNHTLQGGGAYTTEFSSTALQTITGAVGAGRPQEFSSQFVIGIVTNNKDPEEQGRVRVKYPALDDSMEGWWARVVVPHAGNQRGMMMLPLVGDEVLVAFEHDDTTRPFVIGSLFNGKEKPPTELVDKEGSLGIHSVKHVVMKSKEEFKITSGKDMTVKVQGKASLTFDTDAVHEIKQSLKIKAGMNIQMEAGSQLTIKGAMISVQSNGPLEIKGNPVTIDGGAMVSIKGGMVNLG